MTNQKEIKIVFAPGCFDNFDGTQEELDAMTQEITEMFKNKSKEEIEFMSQEITKEDFNELPEELQEHIVQQNLAADWTSPIKRNLQ